MSRPAMSWESVFASMPVPQMLVDPGLQVVAVNDELASLLAWPSAQVEPRAFERLVRAEDEAWSRRFLERLLVRELHRFETDQYLVRADGSIVLVHVSARAIPDAGPDAVDERSLVLIAAIPVPDEVGTDVPGVADRLLEFGHETVTLIDSGGQVVTTRGAQIPIQGYPTTFWRGRSISELLAPGEFERLAGLRDEVVQMPGGTVEADLDVLTGAGERRTITAKVYNCVDDPLLEGFVIVTRDVTEERAVVAELAARRRTAEAVVDAQTRLLATVSHELRNPLHAAHGIAELLAVEDLSPEGSDLAGSLVRQLASLSRITQDLLDAARLDAGTVIVSAVATDLHALVADVVGLARAAQDDRPVTISHRVVHGAPQWALADPDRLRQILSNLVGNAVKFTERGSVQVVMRTIAPGHVSFSVIDTGVGIPLDEHRSVLQPFTVGSTAGDGGGAGLGLAVVERLVSAMDGQLTVRSRVGVGTQVDVLLPLQQCDAPTPHEAVEAGRGIRVLVVEDNPVNQELARRQLERLGFMPTIVGTGEEGLERLSSRPDDYDVVLMDHQLPGWTGVETTRRIRAEGGRLAEIPIIGVSASTTAHDRSAFFDAGMDDLVAKPATLNDLSSAIQRLLTGATAARDDAATGLVPHLQRYSDVVDVAVLTGLADELGGLDTVRRLVTTFLGELPGRTDAVVRAHDAATAAKAAHLLKSSSRLVGAKALADLCERIERGEPPSDELEPVAERTSAALERWRDGRPTSGDERQLRW